MTMSAASTNRLRLGVLLLTGEQVRPADRVIDWAELQAMALMAEAVGFDTVWVEDHMLLRNAGVIVIPEGETRGRYDSWTVLGALAAVTSTIAIGPLVCC